MSDLAVTLEITPPTRPRPKVLLRRAGALGHGVRRVNVIQRPERWSSLQASILLSQAGFDPVWHLANRGRSVAAIEDDVARAADAGLGRVLCIRGEHRAADGCETPRIREVVGILKRRLPRADVSVTLDPFGPRARVLANLRAKLAAGASGVQTQVTFDLVSLAPFAEAIRAEYPTVTITPMLMPTLGTSAAVRLSRRLAVPLPPGLLDRLERFGPDAGWEHFASFARAIAESPLYDGLAVMTPIDPDAAFVARLRAVLADAGWRQSASHAAGMHA